MNSIVRSIVAAVCLAAPLGLTPTVRAQGPLTPPGAPAPTMKTLAQMEPRIPISSAPYTISAPGSYYLSTNLTCTGNGVFIAASGVTLDLMGYTLTGTGGGPSYGVFLDGATNSLIRDVIVRNGNLLNFGGGVYAEYCRDSRFEGLIVCNNTSYGIYLDGSNGGLCDGNSIAECTINGNGFSGVQIYGSSGRCNGNTFSKCKVSDNGSYGFILNGNYGQCNDNTLTDCTVRGNGGHGVMFSGYAGHCDGNTIAGCAVSGNDVYGVYFNATTGHCDGNTVTGCAIRGNGDFGVYLWGPCDGNTLADCVIRNNTGRGISLAYASDNRVEDNHVSGQSGSDTYGIISAATARNLFLRNTCVGHTNNFFFSVNDTYGPIVTNTGALATTGAAAHPWANFSR